MRYELGIEMRGLCKITRRDAMALVRAVTL